MEQIYIWNPMTTGFITWKKLVYNSSMEFLRWRADVPPGDYKDVIFSVLSSTGARTNVILAGKRYSGRLSTSSSGENIVVAEISYQMSEGYK